MVLGQEDAKETLGPLCSNLLIRVVVADIHPEELQIEVVLLFVLDVHLDGPGK